MLIMMLHCVVSVVRNAKTVFAYNLLKTAKHYTLDRVF